jgi:transmembrane sensor
MIDRTIVPLEDCDPLLADPALAEALAERATHGRLSDADIRAGRATRRRAATSLAAGVVVLTLGIVGWRGLPTSTPSAPPVVAHYQTRRGQQIEVQLADGSTMRLNGATSLDVTLEPGRREVKLSRGEAYFDVRHDPARPFSVRAGGAGARVLGTAFDIDVTRGRVELAVYRGAVGFGSDGGDRSGLVVKAGWRSRFRDGAARAPTRFDVTEQDWRQGWLDTRDMQLGDVIEALNRHGGPLIRVPDAALAAIPLAGRFKLDDPERLLQAIGGAYGFQIRREGAHLILVPLSQ